MQTAKAGEEEAIIFLVTPRMNRLTVRRFFQFCCKRGMLLAAKYICEIFRLTQREVKTKYCYSLRKACIGGHKNMAIWLINTFDFNIADIRRNNNTTLSKICENGHPEMMKWVVETFALTINDISAHHHAVSEALCKNGNLEEILWVREKFGTKSKKIPFNFIVLFTARKIRLTDTLPYSKLRWSLNVHYCTGYCDEFIYDKIVIRAFGALIGVCSCQIKYFVRAVSLVLCQNLLLARYIFNNFNMDLSSIIVRMMY